MAFSFRTPYTLLPGIFLFCVDLNVEKPIKFRNNASSLSSSESASAWPFLFEESACIASSGDKSFLALEGGDTGPVLRLVLDVGCRARSDLGALGGDRVRVGVLVPFRGREEDRDRRRGRPKSLSRGITVFKGTN